MISIMTKFCLRRTGFISSYTSKYYITKRSQGRNLDQILLRNAANWFAAVFIVSCHSYAAQAYQPSYCILHNETGPPTLVSNQQNVSQP